MPNSSSSNFSSFNAILKLIVIGVYHNPKRPSAIILQTERNILVNNHKSVNISSTCDDFKNMYQLKINKYFL